MTNLSTMNFYLAYSLAACSILMAACLFVLLLNLNRRYRSSEHRNAIEAQKLLNEVKREHSEADELAQCLKESELTAEQYRKGLEAANAELTAVTKKYKDAEKEACEAINARSELVRKIDSELKAIPRINSVHVNNIRAIIEEAKPNE